MQNSLRRKGRHQGERVVVETRILQTEYEFYPTYGLHRMVRYPVNAGRSRVLRSTSRRLRYLRESRSIRQHWDFRTYSR